MAKVLLVEDDNNLREIYQARLQAEGYDIIAAQNGEEALVVAKQQKPDLVISDVMMPRISGFEMLDILRNTDELKHTKIIMLTALGQAEDQKRADSLGADKYLVKSQVTLEDIVNAAKQLLSEDGIDTPEAPVRADLVADTVPSAPTTTAAPAPAPQQAAVPVVAEPEPAAAPVVPTPAPTPAPSVVAPSPAPEPPIVTPAVDSTPAPAAPDPAIPAPAPSITIPEPEPVPAPAPDPTPSPEPTPSPVGTPEAAPEQPTAPTELAPVTAAPDTMAAADAADTTAQTLEQEEAALQAQIDGYAAQPATATPEVTPADEAAADASNDQAIAEAVEELNTPSTEEPLQPPSVVNAAPDPAATPTPEVPVSPPAEVVAATPTPTPTPVSEANNSVPVVGKKVIQPLNSTIDKPSLDALLAKEESKLPPTPPTPVIGDPQAAAPAVPTSVTPPAAAPGQSFDPNTVAL